MVDVSSVNVNSTSSTASMVCYDGTKTKMPKDVTVSWIVDDMKDKMNKFQPGEWIKTDTFTIKEDKWHFRIYPNGYDLARKENISVCLTSESIAECMVKCEFKGGKSDQGWFKSKRFKKAHEFSSKDRRSVGYFDFISHERVKQNEKKVISRGRVEFEMKVSLVEEGEASPPANLMEETSEINLLRKLSDNFSTLLWDESSSDFQIVCGDDKFHVHRNILKARSSFFNGLFSNDFAETETGHITIKDMDSKTVKSLIEYIYTGKLKDLEAKAIKLLRAANIHDFPLLKKSCEDELIPTINVENAVDIFVLAEDHNASELRAAAKKIILENKAEIVKQDGWGDKLGTLVIELFEDLQSEHFL